MKRVSILMLGVVLASQAGAVAPPAGPFLCIVEQVTGFDFDLGTKSWHEVKFHAGQKFVLKRNDGKPHEVVPGTRLPVSGIWAVWEFGDDRWPVYTCQTEISEYGGLWCDGVSTERFGFNLTSHRFMTDYLLGYLQAGLPGYVGIDGKPLPEGSNTPYISIGTCAAL